MLEWSPDGRFLFSRNDNMPNCIWLWEISKLALTSLISQIEPVKNAQWEPSKTRLALCTGNGRVYMWHPEGASCVEVPISKFENTKRVIENV